MYFQKEPAPTSPGIRSDASKRTAVAPAMISATPWSTESGAYQSRLASLCGEMAPPAATQSFRDRPVENHWITARTSGNAVIEEAIFKVRKEVEEGKTLAEPLSQTEQFPPMVCQMIGVGEQTGALDEMLDKVADFYDSEVDTAVDALTSIIEPIMIVVMGGIVGGMLIAMYLPMFKLVSVVAGG